MEPNTLTYGSLLNVFAKAGDVPRAAHALGVMCTNYSTGKGDKAEPNVQCFTIVLDAFAKSSRSDSGEGAAALLRRMEVSEMPNVAPTAYSYNAVINAWARSRRQDSGRQAERLLREMQEKVGLGEKSFAPRVVSFLSAADKLILSENAHG